MGYSKQVLQQANAQLERQRASHADRQARLREEVYEKLPRVAAIQRQLRQTMAKVIRVSLQKGGDPAAAIEALKAENLALQAECAQLLHAAGYPASALDDLPLCAKCGDRGWVGSQMCDCLKTLCTQAQTQELSRCLDFGAQCFEHFDLTRYSSEHWSQWHRSPRENMEKVLKICQDYAHKFGQYYFDNLFLSGGTGLGKTFLSACIARTVSDSGFSVVYDSAINIFSQFEAQKFSRIEDDILFAQEDTRRYLHCDLLILDDLGSEMTTPLVQATLYQLVNTRLVNGKQTIINSNLSMKDLGKRYSLQVASRIQGDYQPIPFFGEDIRIQRKQML